MDARTAHTSTGEIGKWRGRSWRGRMEDEGVVPPSQYQILSTRPRHDLFARRSSRQRLCGRSLN